MNEITLNKEFPGGLVHRFIVRYDHGCEEAAIEQLIEWANNEELPFDEVDATIMGQTPTTAIHMKHKKGGP